MFSAKKKKARVKIHFEFTVNTARNLVGKLNGTDVYVEWKKGKSKEHKGRTKAATVKNDEANFEGQIISFYTNLLQDEATKSFEPKKVGLTLRKAKKHGKGKKLGTRAVDLATIAKDNLNEPRTYILGDAKKNPPSLIVNVRTSWFKFNGKEIDRKNPPKKDKIVIEGQEFGLLTSDTVSAADSSVYSSSDDTVSELDDDSKEGLGSFIAKGGSLPARGLNLMKEKKKKKRVSTVVDEWKEKSKEELRVIQQQLKAANEEAEAHEKVWHHEKEELLQRLTESEERIRSLEAIKSSQGSGELTPSGKDDGALKEQLAATKSRVKKVKGQLKEAKLKVKETETRLSETEKDLAKVKIEKAELERNLKKDKRVSFEGARPGEEAGQGGEGEDFPVLVNSQVVLSRGQVTKLEQALNRSKEDAAALQKKNEEYQAQVKKQQEEIEALKKAATVSTSTPKGEAPERTSSKKNLKEDKQVKEMQKQVEKAEEKLATEQAKAKKRKDELKAKVKDLEQQVKELKKQKERDLKDSKNHEKEEEKKQKEEDKLREKREQELEEQKKRNDELTELLQKQSEEIVQLKATADAVRDRKASKDAPPLWKEKEDRLKFKVDRLQRRLAQANDEIKVKDREVKTVQAKYQAQIDDLTKKIEELEDEGKEETKEGGSESESEGEGEGEKVKEKQTTLRRRGSSGLRKSDGVERGGGGGSDSLWRSAEGLVLERHALSGFVDGWIAQAQGDKNVKFWWVGAVVLLCLLLTSLW